MTWKLYWTLPPAIRPGLRILRGYLVDAFRQDAINHPESRCKQWLAAILPWILTLRLRLSHMKSREKIDGSP
jgi:hypothetical protein